MAETQPYGYSQRLAESQGHFPVQAGLSYDVSTERKKCELQRVKPLVVDSFALTSTTNTTEADKFEACSLTKTVSVVRGHHAWQSLLSNASFTKILQRSNCIKLDNPDVCGLDNPYPTDITLKSFFTLQLKTINND